MSKPSPAPLIFLQILADRSGKPCALLLDVDADARADANAPEGLLALVDSDAFGKLNATFACLYDGAPGAPLAQALQQAGWQGVDDGAVLRTDAALGAPLAPAVQWIAGNWCLNPPAGAQGTQGVSRALALQLVQKVAADADTHEIETLLRHDPTLSYHLLRLVNSLGMGMGTGRRITSFSQAILLLGRQQLRRWLNLMLFAARQGDVRSAMLLARVAVRARALELLAKASGLDKTAQEQAFMTGMFSLLGVLFGMSLAEVIAPLAVTDAVQQALLARTGTLGALLALIESAEQGRHADVAAALDALQIQNQQFNELIVEATSWMLGVVSETLG